MLEHMFLRVPKISVTTWIASKLQLATVCVICEQQPFSVYFSLSFCSKALSVELESTSTWPSQCLQCHNTYFI